MNDMTLLMWVLIVAPVALALAAAVAPKVLRGPVVILAALVTAAAGILLTIAYATHGAGAVTTPSLPASLHLLPVGIELAVVLVILVVAIRTRRVAIMTLALVQLGLFVAEQLVGGSHGAVSESAADFVIDPLGLILVLIVSVVGSVIVVYAIGYMKEHEHHAPATAASTGRFFLYLVGFLGVMNGLVLANSLQWLSIFWELTTLCSFMLIGHDRTPEAQASARRAILINLFGGAIMMLGGVMSSAYFGAHSLSDVMAKHAMIPMALLCLAALTKSAQMPFQSWLLGAMVAPTPVSALLHSATMVKAGSYLVLRLAPALAGTPLSYLLAIAGAFTFTVTAALAVGQSNAKKVLAYSTISNLGLIVACAGINTPLSYAAALFILCFHAPSKGLLFLCIGTIEQRIGSRDIEDMGQIMYLMPVTTLIALTGMLTMLLAPFGMLISKWLAIESTIHQPLVLVLIIMGSALSVLFWAKWMGRIQTVSFHRHYKYEKLKPSMIAGMLTLAIPVALAGLVTIPLYQHIARPLALLAYPSATPAAKLAAESINYTITWPFYAGLAAAIALGLLTSRLLKDSSVRPPFLCGENITGIERTYTFRSLKDESETAWAGSYYLKGVFSEDRLTFWGNMLAGMIVVVMFGVLGAI